MANAILFTNWTTEDFSWKYGGIDYTFKAQTATYLEPHLAEHFTKHLIDRELGSLGLPTNHHSRSELAKKCVGESLAVRVEEALDKNMKTEISDMLPAPAPVVNVPTSTIKDKRLANLAKARATRKAKMEAKLTNEFEGLSS